MIKTLRYLVIVFVLFISFSAFFLIQEYNKRVSEIISNEQELIDVTYNTIIDAYKKNADILFATSINIPKILNIFHKASLSPDPITQDRYRKRLYHELSHAYNELKKFDIKQLHFHLKNNDSFLRFHRPNKYGDNLTKARKTVDYVNKTRNSISGFEEGKIFNGYRFVFPLQNMNQHLGSMELSISMNAIIDSMVKNTSANINFIIDKRVVSSKVFESERSNYISSDISDDFLYEKSIHVKAARSISAAIKKYKNTHRKLDKKLKSGKTFSFLSTINDQNSIITFYPIKNAISKNRVAYIVLARTNNDILYIKNSLFAIWFVLIFLSAVVLSAFYKINRAKLIANEATNSKSMFLANMSHEIRTPMNAIIGFGNILQKSDLDDNQRKHLQYIQSCSISLLHILNDILDFSKIEAGKLSLEEIPFKMSDIVNDTYAMLNILAKNKGISFNMEYKNPFDDYIIGDPTRVKQIIINLANNAIKFTSKGSVKVNINTLKESDKKINYEIIVSDTGIGIDKEHIDKLFSSFVQADNTTNRKFGGTGLGLSITKSLVNSMRGTIAVDSTIGVGSEFIVNIEFTKDKTHSSDKTTQIHVRNDVDLSSLKVLVVEDNKTNQVLINLMLEGYGIDAVIANNGKEAIDILKHRYFDLILMDIQMPIMDGISATKIIRDINSDVLDHDVYISALSANTMTSDIESSMQAGMNDHLAKPIEREKLYEILLQNLQRKIKNG